LGYLRDVLTIFQQDCTPNPKIGKYLAAITEHNLLVSRETKVKFLASPFPPSRAIRFRGWEGIIIKEKVYSLTVAQLKQLKRNKLHTCRSINGAHTKIIACT
jgi:hypothetical protein